MYYYYLLTPWYCNWCHQDIICSRPVALTRAPVLHTLWDTHLARKFQGHGERAYCRYILWGGKNRLIRFGFHCRKLSNQITAHNGAQSQRLEWDLEGFQPTYQNAYSFHFTADETIINIEQRYSNEDWRCVAILSPKECLAMSRHVWWLQLGKCATGI